MLSSSPGFDLRLPLTQTTMGKGKKFRKGGRKKDANDKGTTEKDASGKIIEVGFFVVRQG